MCTCRLEVVDESAQHAGHAGARETDSPSGETHFRVALVSPEFEGLTTIKRHRLVYQARARSRRRALRPACINSKWCQDSAVLLQACQLDETVSRSWHHASIVFGVLLRADRVLSDVLLGVRPGHICAQMLLRVCAGSCVV